MFLFILMSAVTINIWHVFIAKKGSAERELKEKARGKKVTVRAVGRSGKCTNLIHMNLLIMRRG